MKAVILSAGIGSRLRPLTITKPKSLLDVGDSTILAHMISKLQKNGVDSFVIVGGYMVDSIKNYVSTTFPNIKVEFIINEKYMTTNTGYSLMVAKENLIGESFIKLDGDVIFDEKIIKKLAASNDTTSHVCVDTNAIDEEVIKVICNKDGNISRIGNKVPVTESIGESIGIEMINKETGLVLFKCLEDMMADEKNHQNYLEVAYDEIIRAGNQFMTVDITGINWVEMDNIDDYNQAIKLFATPE